MKKSTMLLAAAPLVLALGLPTVSSLSWAHGDKQMHSQSDKRGGMHKRHHRGGMKFIKKALRDLDLTDDQKQQVKQIMKAQRQANEPLREQLKQSHRQMLSLDTQSSNFDLELATHASEHGLLVSQKIQAMGQTWKQVVQILTPEQQEQLKQKKEDALAWGK